MQSAVAITNTKPGVVGLAWVGQALELHVAKHIPIVCTLVSAPEGSSAQQFHGSTLHGIDRPGLYVVEVRAHEVAQRYTFAALYREALDARGIATHHVTGLPRSKDAAEGLLRGMLRHAAFASPIEETTREAPLPRLRTNLNLSEIGG